MSAVKVIHRPKHHQKDYNKKNSLSIHDLPARKSATKFAITCGKKMNTNTTIADNHKRKVLIRLRLQLHCFAHHDWQKPTKIIKTERTNNYGRKYSINADVTPA